MYKGYPTIDLHAHLRNNIPGHTKIAKESGIDVVVYMANCEPPLDTLEKIKKSLKQKRYCKALPVSAITKNLEGRELVNIEEIKPHVVGFSDDGKYLKDLGLLKEILSHNVLVLAHCSPPYETAAKKTYLETKYVKRYLNVLTAIKGKLHIQHISKKETVNLIRQAKKSGLKFSCETCPHYFTYAKNDLDTKVNPPLAEKEDVEAIKEGLADGTIDVVASDYAPLPRKTGIAGFKSLIPLSYGLIRERTLTENQLKEKLYLNPKRIIKSGGYQIEI